MLLPFWSFLTSALTMQLRDIWLGIVDSTQLLPVPTAINDPFESTVSASMASGVCRWVPNPFSSFRSSKVTGRKNGDDLEARTSATGHDVVSALGVKVDVLAWLARATLDVIGEAGP